MTYVTISGTIDGISLYRHITMWSARRFVPSEELICDGH